MTTNSFHENKKKSARAEGIKKRKLISDTEHIHAAKLVAEKAEELPLNTDCIVSAYIPIGSEINPKPLMSMLQDKGYRLCIPKVQQIDGPLVFYKYDAKTDYTATDEILNPHALIIPLIGFDKSGYRIGYGGGYYDRTLAYLEKSKVRIKIGLAFAKQEMNFVPRNKHDIPLNSVLTERELIECVESNPTGDLH